MHFVKYFFHKYWCTLNKFVALLTALFLTVTLISCDRDSHEKDPNVMEKETLMIDTVDTGIPNYKLSDGSSLADKYAEAYNKSKFKGQFVKIFSNELKKFRDEKLITSEEKAKILNTCMQIEFKKEEQAKD